MILKAKEILQTVFGYPEFRPLQQEVIQSVLEKKDSLVIMPTGGGKSLCYQIPALVFSGITIVVSPLISLMKDQVEQLTQLGVAANYLNSSLSPSQYESNFYAIRSGKIKLVYLAPETLLQERILNLLLSDLHIDCITIDEAHCISEWGHDFRPEYRQIARIRKRFSNAVCVALTATATHQVRDDIIQSLELQQSSLFLDSFNRTNLFLQVEAKKKVVDQTVHYIKERKGKSGIVYCFSRSQVDELTETLQQIGIKALPYHAGLTDSQRSDNQGAFIKDDVDVMVATIAFGMGINKPDVRYVIHFDLPKNVESYYQQIGRAGRDGLPSECVLFYTYGDTKKVEYFINQKEGLEKELAEKQLKQIVNYIETKQCRRYSLLHYFGETYTQIPCGNCDNCTEDFDESQDLTIATQKYLSCVVRTNQLYGNGYISEVLTGSRSKKIIANGHDTLSTYGIGTEFSRNQWKILSELLLRKQLLEKDEEYGSLKITPKATAVLQGKQPFLGNIPYESGKIQYEGKKGRTKTAYQQNNYDEVLFSELKELRKKLAIQKGIPPFVIFHDSTLIELATVYPSSKEDIRKVSGIGIAKAETYGDVFIQHIQQYMQLTGKRGNQNALNRISNAPKTKSKYVEIAELFSEGKTISVIAEVYGNTKETVLTHLAIYVEKGDTLPSNFIKREIALTDEEITRIAVVFAQYPEGFLKPVFLHFEEIYSYYTLRLVRLYFTNENNSLRKIS